MVGEVEDLPTRVVGFMRLKEPRILQNDLSEVNLPTRFVFFCLGRRGEEEELIEFGRCMGTMMVDEVIRSLITYMKNSFDPATTIFSMYKYAYTYIDTHGNILMASAVIWLKYCRYGVKHYPINHCSIYRFSGKLPIKLGIGTIFWQDLTSLWSRLSCFRRVNGIPKSVWSLPEKSSLRSVPQVLL